MRREGRKNERPGGGRARSAARNSMIYREGITMKEVATLWPSFSS